MMCAGIKGMALVLATVLFAGCASTVPRFPAEALAGLLAPPPELVSRIELLLSQDRCIGSLDRWERVYRWRTFPGDFDGSAPAPDERLRTSRVSVTLREAGKFEFVAGVFIEPVAARPAENVLVVSSDDRRYLYASASYDVTSDRLTIRSCGPNMGG